MASFQEPVLVSFLKFSHNPSQDVDVHVWCVSSHDRDVNLSSVSQTKSLGPYKNVYKYNSG